MPASPQPLPFIACISFSSSTLSCKLFTTVMSLFTFSVSFSTDCRAEFTLRFILRTAICLGLWCTYHHYQCCLAFSHLIRTKGSRRSVHVCIGGACMYSSTSLFSDHIFPSGCMRLMVGAGVRLFRKECSYPYMSFSA